MAKSQKPEARSQKPTARSLLLLLVIALSFWPVAARVQDLGQQEAEPAADVAPVEAEDELSSRFMQVVAQGVVELPADVQWRVEKRRALAAWRSEAAESDAGFVLAGTADVVLTDEAGNVWQRLGPGTAAWTPPGELLAAVSDAAQGAPYFEIGLAENGAAGVVGEAFPLPPGTYGIDLVRGALGRTDEAAIGARDAPIVLVVTSGSLFVQDSAGVVSELAAGEPVLLAGETVLSGASRKPATFALARIGAPVVTPLQLGNTGAGTPVAGATPVAVAEASVQIAALVCDGADASDEACEAPASGIPVTIVPADGAELTRVTNRQGEASFTGLSAGKMTLAARLPGGAVTKSVTCDAVEVAQPELVLVLETGQTVTCTWLLEPGDGEAAMGTSLEVDIRACPEGMTLERLSPQACEPASAGSWLTLEERDGGIPLGVGEALPDRWRWDRLDPGSYSLTVDAVPEGAAAFSLGERALGEGETGFPVRIPAGFVMRGETLYLYPPDVPRTQSLAIETWGCPPGMTGETLVPELCTPLTEGVELGLYERGAALPVFAAQDGAWVWTELGALPYDLEIETLPEGFSGGQLENDCCESESVFPLRLNDAEPETRHVLYLWRPFDVGSERDTDEDGLPDMREVEVGTNPFLADSDSDGLGDQDEVDFYGTDPLAVDTDGDSLTDAEEVSGYFTNPFLADSDGDGVDDAAEIVAGTDPLEVMSLPGTPQPPGETPLLTPTATATPTPTETAMATPLSTVEPTAAATPAMAATPAILATPLAEAEATPRATPVAQSGGASSHAPLETVTSAMSPEFALDGDGLTTLDELAIYSTDPTRADTDGDGVNDGDEVAAGTDPRDPDDR